ncbi:MAG: AlkZ family DNA glycosylase [Acidimicrobiia bacterium]|nr:AlkZ family DNA glycosylase [Acidimicrobiia bacterium]
MRTLSQRELLLALLDRQLLLRRSRGLSIPQVLERMGGLQAQYAPSMYVGLWTRMERFSRSDLDGALNERTVVQGTLLRSTIHLVSVDDYWLFAAGIRDSRKQWWLRSRKDTDPAQMDAAVDELRRYLRSPTRAKEIEQALGTPIMAFNQWIELLRVPPSGTWDRRRADLYALAEDWIEPVRVSRADAVDHLIRRYLGAFGPATAADIASWAGLSPKTISAAAEGMDDTLRHYAGESGDDLVDLGTAKLPSPDTPVPVRFLPVWDATMLVHARRTAILPEEYRTILFNSKNPQSFNTFLVDGQVAGTWKNTPTGIDLSPFKKLPKTTAAAVEAEAEALHSLHE